MPTFRSPHHTGHQPSTLQLGLRSPCLGLCSGCTVTSLTDSNSHLTEFGQQSGCTVKSSSFFLYCTYATQARSSSSQFDRPKLNDDSRAGTGERAGGCELDIGWPIMAVGKELHRWLLFFQPSRPSEQHQIWGTAALCHGVRASNHLPSCLPTLVLGCYYC
jgi:hypothetical protein